MTTTKQQQPQWAREFGRDYAVPDAIANYPQFDDISWHNDICPSFALKTADFDSGEFGRLWVDHINAHEREAGPDTPAYIVTTNSDCSETSYQGEDIHAAIAALIATGKA